MPEGQPLSHGGKGDVTPAGTPARGGTIDDGSWEPGAGQNDQVETPSAIILATFTPRSDQNPAAIGGQQPNLAEEKAKKMALKAQIDVLVNEKEALEDAGEGRPKPLKLHFEAL